MCGGPLANIDYMERREGGPLANIDYRERREGSRVDW